MSKRELARVFFEYEAGKPIRLIGLELDNHVGHVTELARHWNGDAYGKQVSALVQGTRARVIRAAQRHDEGKPRTFKLLKETCGTNGHARISYSFRGHRFLVSDDDPYVDWLIRLHHEYDVATITEAQADLKRQPPQRDYPGPSPDILAECFPYDLYTLEMCDQIDAEASSWALSPDDKDDRERPFMEYHSRWDKDARTLYLYPWPFRDSEITLEYPSFVVAATSECQRELADAKANEAMPRWQRLATDGEPIEWQKTVSVTLAPETVPDDNALDFYPRISGYAANPMQTRMLAELGPDGGSGFVLLKAPTGSGKTEAVVAPALERGRRLFLVLPSRALVEDQRQRLSTYLQKVSEIRRRASLIVDTGEHAERRVWVGGEERTPGRGRHLYDADVVVTTLDSFLFRFFAFGAGNKSYIFPLRIQLYRERQRPLFCFDEAHSYDTLAWQNFLSLVEALACDMGGDVVIMSATVSRKAQAQIERLGADTVDFAQSGGLDQLRAFQRRKHPDLRLRYEACEKGALIERLMALAIKEWRPGRRVIVCVERVKSAIEIYGALAAHVPPEALTLYHGRLDADDRRGRYQSLKERDEAKAGEGYVLVTTSAIEVGCDLDAHVLITDLCFPEQLVQRAGRCNRRAQHPDATLYVVGNYLGSLPELERSKLEKAMIGLLRSQHNAPFRPDDFIALIQPDLSRDDRADVLFSLLYEYVYQGDRTAKPAHDKGLVLTRSWEPSITLMEIDERGEPHHKVQVPLSRCTLGKDEEPDPRVRLRREVYNEETRRMQREEVKFGGCCYLHRLVAELPQGYYDEQCGYANPPRFLRRLRSHGYQCRVAYTSGDSTVYLWYLAPVPGDGDEAGDSAAASPDEHEANGATEEV